MNFYLSLVGALVGFVPLPTLRSLKRAVRWHINVLHMSRKHTMKTTFTLLSISFIAAILFTSAAQAGSAFIPWWMHYPSSTWCLSVSNVSHSALSVTVILFKEDGKLYTGKFLSQHGGKIGEPIKLQPNESSGVCLQKIPGEIHFGYGRIEHTGSTHAVVAFAQYADQKNHNRWLSIPINGSQPF